MTEEKRNKMITYSVALIVILILIVILYFIWAPTFSKLDSSGINKYEDKNYEEEIKKFYNNYLSENLKITNFDKLYLKLDKDYLSEIGINEKDKVKEFFRENSYISMNITINSIDIYDKEIGKLLVATYTVNDGVRYAYINEITPYNFTLSFMKDEELSENLLSFNKNKVVDDIEYNVEIIQATKNNIKLKLSIINNSANTLSYDFSYLDSIQLEYGENKIVNIAALANSNNSKFELTPGSTNSCEATFNLSWSDQININKIIINNIKLNGSDYKVEI